MAPDVLPVAGAVHVHRFQQQQFLIRLQRMHTSEGTVLRACDLPVSESVKIQAGCHSLNTVESHLLSTISNAMQTAGSSRVRHKTNGNDTNGTCTLHTCTRRSSAVRALAWHQASAHGGIGSGA